jgi:prepilin signal peptidase PulO-like enzyme (type II secretory pathway)
MILIDNQWLLLLLVAILGLAVGSFLNVVIYRLPLMMQDSETDSAFNLWLPGSHCPFCKEKLHWYDNVPLVSYLLQLGKCRYCQRAISWRYPLVEVLTAALSVAIAMRFPELKIMCLVLVFTWLLIPMVFIDFEHQILPDGLTLGLLWVGLLANSFGLVVPPQAAILGAAMGYIVFWGIAKGYYLLRRVEGMGAGDFKLLAALGAWLGWQALPMILIISGVLALLVSFALVLLKRRKYTDTFAFGPYLAIAGWLFVVAMRVGM